MTHNDLSCLPHSPWIKICGLTDPKTAVTCANLGADAIGLVFFKKSPRNVFVDQASAISRALPPSAIPIGVFVDQDYEAIMIKANQCGLKGVQLHGNEPPSLVERLQNEGLIVIKALFAARPPLLESYPDYIHASFILVEYGKGILPGGNAESWDYSLSHDLSKRTGLVLAGGLDASNVCKAVRDVLPSGIDVSSGVEKAPGVKEITKVKKFIRAVRSCSPTPC